MHIETKSSAMFWIDTDFFRNWLVELTILNAQGRIMKSVHYEFYEKHILKTLNVHELGTFRKRLVRFRYALILSIPLILETASADIMIEKLTRSE